MPKKKPPQTLPEDWVSGERKSLRVVEDLGFPSRGVPDGLVVQKITKSKNLEATYLPLAEDDPRDAGGGASNRTRSALIRCPLGMFST